ncbi:MAG: EamA family transporter RarD [Novosphingobium sp.]
MNASEGGNSGGLPHAMAAYFIWGFLPLYLFALKHIPPLEMVGWRIVFTVPVCFMFLLASRQMGVFLQALRNWRAMGLMLASALLIGGNWLIYTTAVQEGHVFAASLGYYINPLVNVLAGTLFLGERLSTRQWVAVGIAGAGVSLLAWDALAMLGISLALALSFCIYGLVRKLAPIASLPGLALETVLLSVPAIFLLNHLGGTAAGLHVGQDWTSDVLLSFSGVITASALLFFTVAAKRMDYSTLGFVQYLSPTIAFALALFVFHEPLRPLQLACFVLIWTAIAVFSWDLWARRTRR